MTVKKEEKSEEKPRMFTKYGPPRSQLLDIVKKTMKEHKKPERESIPKGTRLEDLVKEEMAKRPEKPRKKDGLRGVYERQKEILDFRHSLKEAYKAAAKKYPHLFIKGKIEDGIPVLKPEVEQMAEDFLSDETVETEDGITNPLMTSADDMTTLMDNLANEFSEESGEGE
jgi:hypothetical protein